MNLFFHKIFQKTSSTVCKSYLAEIEDDYDYIIIDCAPGFSGINTGAFCASDLIIIPAAPDRYGVDGVDKTITELAQLNQTYKSKVDFKILLNRYDARKSMSAEQLINLNTRYPQYMMSCYIRENSEIPNSTGKGVSVFENQKKVTTAKEDLDILAKDILGLRKRN